MTTTQQVERTETDAAPQESNPSDGMADPPEAESEPLPIDEIFGLLKNERRRLTLQYLQEHDEPVSLGDLAESIASHENGKPEAQLNAMERKRAYVGLYQCHLPMMDDRGAVEFNKPRGRISLGENFEVFEEYLSDIEGGLSTGKTSWHRVYLMLSGLGAALFGAGLLVSNPLFMRLALGGVVGAFALCSFFEWRAARSDAT